MAPSSHANISRKLNTQSKHDLHPLPPFKKRVLLSTNFGSKQWNQLNAEAETAPITQIFKRNFTKQYSFMLHEDFIA